LTWTISATLKSATTNTGIAGQTVVFKGPAGRQLCSTTTGTNGVASCSALVLGNEKVSVSYAGNSDYLAQSTTVTTP
jgi:hypothetical protein